MEREIVIKTDGKEAKITTKVSNEVCLGCVFLYEEMVVLLRELELTEGNFQAIANCRSRGSYQKHINIKLNTGNKSIDADSGLKNWNKRNVHCIQYFPKKVS